VTRMAALAMLGLSAATLGAMPRAQDDAKAMAARIEAASAAAAERFASHGEAKGELFDYIEVFYTSAGATRLQVA